MKTLRRILGIAIPCVLSLFVGLETRNIWNNVNNLLPFSIYNHLWIFFFFVALTSLIIGIIIISRLVGAQIDNIRTQLFLIAGGILISSGSVWLITSLFFLVL
jgi:hypothetical protein